MNNPIYEVWMNDCINYFGQKVSNYRNDHGWIDLSVIFEDLNPIMIMLNSMALNNNRYKLVRGDNANGQYTTASRYSALWRLKEIPPWSRAWILGLIPKFNMSYWLALQDKIHTQDNLIKIGHFMPSRCELCKD